MWGSGALGVVVAAMPAAPCPLPRALGGGGQLVPLNLTGDLVKVQEAPRWCIFTQCPGQLVPRPHFEECVHTGEFPQPWQPKPESFRWMPLAESGPVCALPRSAVSTSASPSASWSRPTVGIRATGLKGSERLACCWSRVCTCAGRHRRRHPETIVPQTNEGLSVNLRRKSGPHCES